VICKRKLECPYLVKEIDKFLISTYPHADDEKSMADALVRKIDSLASEEQHIRAKQVTEKGNCINTSTQALPFIRKHCAMLGQLDFLDKMLNNPNLCQTIPQLKEQAKAHLNLDSSELEQLCFLHLQLKDFCRELEKVKEGDDPHAKSTLIDNFLSAKRVCAAPDGNGAINLKDFKGAISKERTRTMLTLFCGRMGSSS
jgi:hypothetical protein